MLEKVGYSATWVGESNARFGEVTKLALPRQVLAPAPVPAVLFQRFEVRKTLAKSTYWRGYEVFDRRLRCEGTLHVVSAGAPDRERRMDDARRWESLNEPGIVRVHEVTSFAEGFFVLAEKAEGTPLPAWMQAPRTLHETISVFQELGQALASSHKAGLVWGPIRPQFVLLDALGRPRIANAPESLVADRPVPPPERPMTIEALRTAYTERGWPGDRYTAPELDARVGLDERTDQYAFAVALWEALVGTPPFAASSMTTLFEAKLEAPLRRPPQVPRPLMRLLARALLPLSRERWSSMNALLQALERRKLPHRNLWLGAALCTTLAAAGGLYASHSQPTGCRDDATVGWNASVSARIAGRFSELGSDGNPHGWPGLRAHVDGYADTWRQQWHELCAADDRAALQAAFQCLATRRSALETLIQNVTLDHRTMASAATAVDQLPLLEPCKKIPAGTSTSHDESVARNLLARAQVLFDLERLAQAKAAVASARERLRGVSSSPTLVQATLLAGRIAAGEHERDVATAELERAFDEATSAKLHELRLEAALALAEFHLRNGSESSVAERWVTTADGLLDDGAAPRSRVRLAWVKAKVAFDAGQHEQAARIIARELERSKSALATSPTLLPLLRLETRARIVANPEANEVEIIGNECQSTSKILGASHPRHARCLERLAVALVTSEKPQQAAEKLRLAIDVHRRWNGSDATAALSELAHIMVAEGRPAESVTLLTEAVQNAPESDRGPLLQELGFALAETGDHERALQAYARAWALLKTAKRGAAGFHVTLATNILSLHQAPALERLELGTQVARASGMDPAELAPHLAAFGDELVRAERKADALPQYRAALELAHEQKTIAGETYTAWALEASKRARELGDDETARQLLARALSRESTKVDEAKLRFAMAQLLWSTKERRRAIELAERALSLIAKSREHRQLRAQIKTWLDG